MIVKVMQTPADGISSFQRLVSYVEAAKPSLGEKCLYKNWRGFDEIECSSQKMRIGTMMATASSNVLCKDPVWHGCISFREGEIPTKQQIEECVDIYLKKYKFEGYQVVYGVHQNTDNIHIHIALNRIHPETGKAANVFQSYKTAQMIAREIELKQGWSHDKSGKFYEIIDNEVVGKNNLSGDDMLKTIPQAARSFERRSGEKSAIRIAQNEVAKTLFDAIDEKINTWAELNEKLAEKGFEIRKTGRGGVLVYHKEDEEEMIKLSSVSQKLSMNKLEAKLGEFRSKVHTIKVQEQEPKALIDDNKDLKEYVKERTKFNKLKKEILSEQKNFKKFKRSKEQELKKQQFEERKTLYGQKGKWIGKGKELNIRRSLLASKQLNEKQKLKNEITVMQAELNAKLAQVKHSSFPEYGEWQEQKNNPDAKWKFIYAQTWQGIFTGETLTGELHFSTPQTKTFLDSYSTVWNDQKKTLNFYRNNSLAFRDNGYRINVLLHTDENIKDAMLLAQEKWGKVKLYGTDEFKKKAAEIAVQNGIEITNPELQEYVQMKKEEQQKTMREAGTVARKADVTVKEHIIKFNDYTALLSTDCFRITCSKPTEDGKNKVFLLKNKDNEINMKPYEIQAQWQRIEMLNNSGWNIYVTPVPEDTKKELYILVDDLNKENLERMKTEGFKPATIIESSPGNYQAIIIVEKNFIETDDKSKQLNKSTANLLMRELNKEYGDKNICAALHPHRIPGMNNNKLKRIAENGGTAPEVKLMEYNIDKTAEEKKNKQTQAEKIENKIGIGVHCPKAQTLFNKHLADCRAKLKEEERAAAEIMQRAAKAGNIGTIDPVEAFVIHAKDIMQHYTVSDYSRLDSEVVMRMKATGYSHAEIKEAVEKGSPAVRPKDRRNKQWANYAEKTAKYADSFACAQKITQQEHRIGAWLALEGRTKNKSEKQSNIKHR